MTIKFHLSSLDMDEVSYVSAGDNPGAKILLTKSKVEDEAESYPANVLDGEEIAHVNLDDGDLYVTTAKGSLYMFPRANLSKSEGGGTTVEAEDPVLLVEDLDDDEGEEDSAEQVEKGLFERFMKWWRSDEVTPVEKAKFADMMQSKMADQVYEEMYQLGMTLRAAIDDEMLSGTATVESLKGSLQEFVTVVEDAIENRWLSGKLVNKELDPEMVEKVARRDEEVVGVVNKTGEGGASVGEGDAGSYALVDKTKGDVVAGIDRSKLSKEETTYLDTLEQKVEVLEGQVSALQGSGSSEDSELEKSLASLPEPLRKEFRAQREKIAKMEREAEEREYVEKVLPLTALSVNPTELGKALRNVEKGEAGSEEYKLILETLQGANEVVKMGGDILFDSIGKRRPNSDGSASAHDEVMEKAEALAASEGIDIEVALGKVRSNPGNRNLIERYDAEEAS